MIKVFYYDILKKLYPTYPRQVGYPERREVRSFDELVKNIKIFNKKQRIFISIYNYSFNNTQQVDVPFIFFDFDSVVKVTKKEIIVSPYENAMTLYNYVKAQNLKSFFVFSGGGFHCYILTKNYKNLSNPKSSNVDIFNFHLNLYPGCLKVQLHGKSLEYQSCTLLIVDGYY